MNAAYVKHSLGDGDEDGDVEQRVHVGTVVDMELTAAPKSGASGWIPGEEVGGAASEDNSDEPITAPSTETANTKGKAPERQAAVEGCRAGVWGPSQSQSTAPAAPARAAILPGPQSARDNQRH